MGCHIIHNMHISGMGCQLSSLVKFWPHSKVTINTKLVSGLNELKDGGKRVRKLGKRARNQEIGWQSKINVYINVSISLDTQITTILASPTMSKYQISGSILLYFDLNLEFLNIFLLPFLGFMFVFCVSDLVIYINSII